MTQSHSLLVPVFIDQAYKADYVEQGSSVWRLTEKGNKALPEKIKIFIQNKISQHSKIKDVDLLSSLYLEFDNQILFQMAHKSGMSIEEMLGTALIYGQEQGR